MNPDEIQAVLDYNLALRKKLDAESADSARRSDLSSQEFRQLSAIVKAGLPEARRVCELAGLVWVDPEDQEILDHVDLLLRAKRATRQPVGAVDTLPNYDRDGDPDGWWMGHANAVPGDATPAQMYDMLRERTKAVYAQWDVSPPLLCSPGFNRRWEGLTARLRAALDARDGQAFTPLVRAALRAVSAMSFEIRLRNRVGENDHLFGEPESLID